MTPLRRRVALRILVADDHPVTRKGLCAIAEECFPGARVGEAGEALAVLQLVAAEDWQLILLDILMPGGLNILDLIREIRANNATVPVLVITAATDLSYVVQSMKAGANGLIHKHLPPEEFASAIRTVAAGGTYLHSETAIAIARSLNDRQPERPHDRLSQRELDILRRLALGRAVKGVAGDLNISEKTVATYIARIRQKTGLANAVEMTRYALQHDLVD